MKHVLKVLLTLSLVFVPSMASAQLDLVILEAENGAVGSQLTTAADGATSYATIQSTIGGVATDRLVIKEGGSVLQP
jgi:hypothetical protein